jgi:hypothetical protein
MRPMSVTPQDPDPGREASGDTCDYCHLPLDAAEARTSVGSTVFHRQPNCYLRKLFAIHH